MNATSDVKLHFYHCVNALQHRKGTVSHTFNPSHTHTRTQPGDYSISMKAPDKIKHFNVKNLPDGRLGIGQRKFDSMDELIAHYRRAPIYTTTNEGKMYLTQGLPRR